MTEQEPQAEVDQSGREPSIVLMEARQKAGLSQKEVADKLYLTTTFIKYIDDGEFERIPKPAFIKGYLRSYARIVGLSGDEIVAMYDAALQSVAPTPEIKGVTEEAVGTASITGPVLQTGLIGLAGLGLLVALVWWLVSDDDEPTVPVAVSQVSNPASAVDESAPPAFDFVIAATSEQAGSEPSDSELSGREQADVVMDDTVAESGSSVQMRFENDGTDGLISSAEDEGTAVELEVATEAPDDMPALPSESSDERDPAVKIERNIDGERTFISVDAGGFDEIELEFSDECWVEISDDEIGSIYNDLNRRNDRVRVYGTSPFRVLLGKATAVEMIYNGRPFELKPFIGQDLTAKLTISE